MREDNLCSSHCNCVVLRRDGRYFCRLFQLQDHLGVSSILNIFLKALLTEEYFPVLPRRLQSKVPRRWYLAWIWPRATTPLPLHHTSTNIAFIAPTLIITGIKYRTVSPYVRAALYLTFTGRIHEEDNFEIKLAKSVKSEIEFSIQRPPRLQRALLTTVTRVLCNSLQVICLVAD